MTLTTPSILARSELVAQWAKAVNLCGIVTRIPSTFRAAKTRHDDVEVIGRHLHRNAHAVVATAPRRYG
jgi:hypothetical protein